MRLKGKPFDELIVWIQIGLQRESLVSEAYSQKYVKEQIDSLNLESEISSLLFELIGILWAQERYHQRYTGDVLSIINPAKNIIDEVKKFTVSVKGSLEGRILASLQSKKLSSTLTSTIAIALGEYVTQIPDFIKSLERGSFKDFCLVNAALEKTAITGYKRIGELLTKISLESERNLRHTSLTDDFSKIYYDEQYHFEIFNFLSNFPPPDNSIGIIKETGSISSSTGSTTRHQIIKQAVNSLSLKIEQLRKSVYGRYSTEGRANFRHARKSLNRDLNKDPLALLLRENLKSRAAGYSLPMENSLPRSKPIAFY